ncbi:MAG: O-antigen ligase family protein [Bdellovibrionales bacterium]|nr:O-antigen ligase family protein [Massilia sp.]
MRFPFFSARHYRTAPAANQSHRRLAHLAFLLLFPGFFFYQTLLGLGKMGAFLGGYFSEIIVLLILPLLFSYAIKFKRYGLNSKVDLYFAIFLAYFLLIIGINFLAGANLTTILNHLRTIGYLVTLFIVFKTIDLDDQLFKLALIMSLVGMAAIIFSFSVDGTFYLANQNLARDSDSVATYQGFSRSYFITLAVVVSFIKLPWQRALIYCIAVPALYVNGARSEFVGLLFMLPIIEICRSQRKLRTLAVIIAILAIVALNFELIISTLPTNRMLELLDLSQSTSANARHELKRLAINTIVANPVLGEYASYPPGDYAHNVLSAWVDLGLFGFIFILSLLLLPALSLIPRGLFGVTTSNECLLAFCLLSVTFFLLCTSHTFLDMTTGAALGAFSNYQSRRHL